MEHPEPEREMPYGKIAAWGIAASALLTSLFLVTLAPASPVALARQLIPGHGNVHVLYGPAAGGHAGARAAVREALAELDAGPAGGGGEVIPWARDLEVELELHHGLPDIGRWSVSHLPMGLSREWGFVARSLASELGRDWARIGPLLGPEIVRSLDSVQRSWGHGAI